jgi:mono/diheme cytochrome c family protein
MRAAHIIPPILAIALLSLIGCKRDDMADQPRGRPLRETKVFADETLARPLVPGTIARDQLPIRAARAAATQPEAKDFPTPLTFEDLQRGRERYQIYCAVCHGPSGDGFGMIVQRGFVRPPAFYPIAEHQKTLPQLYERERVLADMPPGHVVNVIVNGYGAMYSYADRVAPEDRWRIAGYIRALQLSRNATLDKLPESDRTQVQLLSSSTTAPTTQPDSGGDFK